MYGGILVGHGTFSECLLGMVEKINGKAESMAGVSNTGLSTSDIVDEIQGLADSMNSGGLFLFVDVFGGSCWRAAKMVKARRDNIHIMTGTNLPMLLSFLNKRADKSFDELPEILAHDGVRGITSE